MDRKKQIFLLILLMLVLFILNYRFLDAGVKAFFEDREYVKVERVIDGDTIVIDTQGGHENLSRGGESVRLLGINSPERGEVGFEEAKEFLEMVILGKEVELEFGIPKYDKYNRLLAYVYRDNANVNLEMVEEGFANYYFYSDGEKYSQDLIDAWERCIERNVNLCKKSLDKCSRCISIDSKNIVNNCGFDCDVGGWIMHSEGRKKFVFDEQILNPGEKANFEIDLSDTGNTIFLRDGKGKLVEWHD